jgi:hypothetical protein
MSASPGAATVVTTVAAYTLRAWFNDLERSFGSRAAARTIVVGWGLLLLAWLVVGTRQLIEVLSLDAEQAAFVAGPTAAMVIALPAITTLMATVYSPSRTAMGNLLAVLPVQRAHRVAAVRWLSAGLGLVIGGAWAMPLAAQLVVAAPLAHAPILVVCLAALAVTGPLAAQLIYELAVRLLGPAIGSDRVVTRALAALATALCVAAAFVSSLPSEDRPDGGVC